MTVLAILMYLLLANDALGISIRTPSARNRTPGTLKQNHTTRMTNVKFHCYCETQKQCQQAIMSREEGKKREQQMCNIRARGKLKEKTNFHSTCTTKLIRKSVTQTTTASIPNLS